jgi:hypothetical protein
MKHRNFRLAAFTAVAVIASAASVSAFAPSAAHRPGARPDQAGLAWSALGDSYTAGAIPAAGDEFEHPRDGCVRTTDSYPEVIARDLGPLVSLKNVSCGNATIENITTVGQFPIGHEIPSISTDPDYPFPQVSIQLRAVNLNTRLVTVGIGGNSLGFGEILQTCLRLGALNVGIGTPCKNFYTKDAVGDEPFDARFRDLGAEYDEMLFAIHQAAPAARIITVGYPFIIPDDTSKCTFGLGPVAMKQFSTITRGDLEWLRTHVIERLNSVIEDETVRHGDTYVNIYNSGRGHSVCDSDKWVEGILDTQGRPALVHPNSAGQENTARHVERAILGLDLVKR